MVAPLSLIVLSVPGCLLADIRSGDLAFVGETCGTGCDGSVCMETSDACFGSADLDLPCVGTATDMYCSTSCTSDDDCESDERDMRCLDDCPGDEPLEGVC